MIVEFHVGPNFEQVARREKDLINYLEKAGLDKPVVNDIFTLSMPNGMSSLLL